MVTGVTLQYLLEVDEVSQNNMARNLIKLFISEQN